jgi:hypothetical protein
MVSILGPYSWSGDGDENLGGLVRIIAIATEITAYADDVAIVPTTAFQQVYRQGWIARCADLTSLGMTALSCDVPTYLEQTDMSVSYNPDTDGVHGYVRYSIRAGGAVTALVFTDP